MAALSNLASLLVGLAAGGVFGIHIAQKYELPDIHSLTQKLLFKAGDFEKSVTKASKKDE